MSVAGLCAAWLAWAGTAGALESARDVRDATGVVVPSDFPSTAEFNAVSAELNRRVEEQVLPAFKEEVTVGCLVDFVGCIAVDVSEPLHPMDLIPIQLQIPSL